jgi:hypothetical protein
MLMAEKKKINFSKHCFHRLSLLPSNKECVISFADLIFHFSNEEMALFSPRIFQYCNNNGTPFEIPLSKSVSEIRAFITLFQSLFISETSMLITQENSPVLSFLAEEIDLPILNQTFIESSEHLPFEVSLNFRPFLSLSPTLHSLLNNFALKVNEKEYKCNLPFLCCISDKIFKIVQQNPTLTSLDFQIETKEEKEEELNECISRFISFLKGKSISFEGISSEILSIIMNFLEILGFDESLEKEIPIPQCFEELVQFLQFHFSSRLKNHFSQSIEIVSSEFYKINQSDILKFELNTFEAIFSHSSFKIKSENELFRIISKLIKFKSHFIILLKYIHLSYIDLTVLNEFFFNN